MKDINAVTMAELEQAMQEGIDQLGGIDQALSACDRMYSATFRSEPRKLSAIKWSHQGAAYQAEEVLYCEMATKLYTLQVGVLPPVYNEDDHEDSYSYNVEHYEESAIAWFRNKYPNFTVDSETLVVDFCNYKGEGDNDLALYCVSKHFPVFTCKADSFNAVN